MVMMVRNVAPGSLIKFHLLSTQNELCLGFTSASLAAQ